MTATDARHFDEDDPRRTCGTCGGAGRLDRRDEGGRYSVPCTACTYDGPGELPIVLIASRADFETIAYALHSTEPDEPVTAFVDLLLAQHTKSASGSTGSRAVPGGEAGLGGGEPAAPGKAGPPDPTTSQPQPTEVPA